VNEEAIVRAALQNQGKKEDTRNYHVSVADLNRITREVSILLTNSKMDIEEDGYWMQSA
jgi:hypothetical protein